MIIHGDVAFMLLSSVLVLIMTPGLAFFYAGLVPRKHSLTMMFQSFIAIGIITILWIFGGFGMTFGSDIGGIIGNPLDYFGFKGMDYLMNAIYNENLPFFSFYMYQLMFAIITAPLMTGAYANRLTVPAWIKILIAWMILIYFPVAHWVWGDGFLARLGFVDYAGGSLATAEIATIVFTNTGVAGASAMITWITLHYFEHKEFSFLEIIIGLVAGLATVTPCARYIRPLSAFFVGIIGAIVCYLCVIYERKRIDYALDVWGVHGVGGFLGTLLVGIFANPMVNNVSRGFYQFGIQLFGAVLVAIYSIVVTYLIFKVLDIKKPIKASDELQVSGLDEAFFKESFSDYKHSK